MLCQMKRGLHPYSTDSIHNFKSTQTTTSRCAACRARRSRSCHRASAGGCGVVPAARSATEQGARPCSVTFWKQDASLQASAPPKNAVDSCERTRDRLSTGFLGFAAAAPQAPPLPPPQQPPDAKDEETASASEQSAPSQRHRQRVRSDSRSRNHHHRSKGRRRRRRSHSRAESRRHSRSRTPARRGGCGGRARRDLPAEVKSQASSRHGDKSPSETDADPLVVKLLPQFTFLLPCTHIL